MRLCIIKIDGSSEESYLSNVKPSLNHINNEILLFENHLYKLIIRSEEIFDSMEVFIGEYSIPLIFNAATGCYETERKAVFSGCFDLTCVSVNIDYGYGEEKMYFSEYFRVATTKQTVKQVEQMLDEIEKNIPNFLEICFSHNWKKAGLLKNNVRSVWSTLKIIDEIINIYEENYGYFRNNKKSVVQKETVVVDIKSMRQVDQECLIWIASNPDSLTETKKDSIIKYKEKKYIPKKIKTYASKYSYDTYENRMILGFIRTIIDYIDNQVRGYSRRLLELESIPNSIIIQIPNTHGLTGRCLYVYYKSIVHQFEKKKEILEELYYRYVNIFECVGNNIVGLPKLTNTFKQVYSYKVCYECMVKWFEFGGYTFEHLNYLFKLKTLSRIFEYYCLIKLQISILQNDYKLIESNRINDGSEDDLENINNKYVFSGHGCKLTLFYEPSIWVKRFNEGMNLYSTGYNFTKCKWNNRWSPDFVLKISTLENEYYYILDAKYSNSNNVIKRYLPQLVLKYGSQIASKDKFISDVIGIGAIYPGDSDKMNCFKKNDVNSKKQSLPVYFSLAIAGEDKGNIDLGKRMKDLLSLINILECEKEEETIYEGSLVDFKEDSKYCDIRNKVLEDDNSTMVSKKENDVYVYGKNCFYYSIGICLRQKSRCKIEGNICRLYEHKSSRELFKEEYSCRHFTRSIRKGKVKHVECSVFKLNGCIGTEKCKFYLKKNKG